VVLFWQQGDRVVIHWHFSFVHPTGRMFELDELVDQLWQGDKVLRERFYYDPALLPR
jgi:hypothetical protein